MAQEAKPECSGKCQMVDTYKSINRALTNQNTEFKEALALKDREISELRQMVLDLRTQNAEYVKSSPVNIKDTIDFVAATTEAFASISETVQRAGEKLAFISNKVLNSVDSSAQLNSSVNITPTRTASQSKTPSNISRIRPMIRTPNGLMHTGLSISLPRIDQSMFFTTVDRLANSTTISEDLSTSPANVPAESETVSDTIGNTSPEPIRNATAPSVLSRLPRHTSEMPSLEEAEVFENATRPNPEIVPIDPTQDDSYYQGGLSVIEEVTEIDYTVNQRATNVQEDDSSSGGEEITSHRRSRSVRSNKENTLRRIQFSSSMSGATSSTPYNSVRHHERLSNMKVAQVVLQPLNMDEFRASQNIASSNGNDSEDSEEPSRVSTRKNRGRKRKDVSSNNENSDDESSSITGRPKRRATPTSFKEPSLNTKMRRPK